MPSFAQEPKPVVIGGTLGLTGILSEASNDYKAVYDRWLEQVNKKGGVLVLLASHPSENGPGVPVTRYWKIGNVAVTQHDRDCGSLQQPSIVTGPTMPEVEHPKDYLILAEHLIEESTREELGGTLSAAGPRLRVAVR